MSRTRKTVVAAFAASGLALATAPLAGAATGGFGDEDHGGDSGVVNVNDNQVPVQACNNEVPVNVLGVQVPVSDITGAIGLGADDTTATTNNECGQKAHQKNDNG